MRASCYRIATTTRARRPTQHASSLPPRDFVRRQSPGRRGSRPRLREKRRIDRRHANIVEDDRADGYTIEDETDRFQLVRRELRRRGDEIRQRHDVRLQYDLVGVRERRPLAIGPTKDVRLERPAWHAVARQRQP